MHYKLGEQTIVAFYDSSDSEGWMANTARDYPITIGGVSWPTTEHYFQAMKFPGDDVASKNYRQAILTYDGPYSQFPEYARNMSEKFIPLDQRGKAHWEEWDKRKLDVMRRAVREKLDQHKKLEEKLLAFSDNALIVEALPDRFIRDPKKDTYWADGADGSGQNQLGIIITEELLTRKKLLTEEKAIQEEAQRRSHEFQTLRLKNFPKQTAYSIKENLSKTIVGPVILSLDDEGEIRAIFDEEGDGDIKGVKKGEPIQINSEQARLFEQHYRKKHHLNEKQKVIFAYPANSISAAKTHEERCKHPGGGLAAVFEVADFHTAPIPTITAPGASDSFASQEEIKHYIAQLYYYAGQGHLIVLPKKNKQFAFGGGVSEAFLKSKQSQYLQEELTRFNDFMEKLKKAATEEERKKQILACPAPFQQAFTRGQVEPADKPYEAYSKFKAKLVPDHAEKKTPLTLTKEIKDQLVAHFAKYTQYTLDGLTTECLILKDKNNSNQHIFIIEPQQIRAAKKDLETNEYTMMLEAAKITFPGRKLFLYIPDADQEKVKQAIENIKKSDPSLEVEPITETQQKKNDEKKSPLEKKDPIDKPKTIKDGEWYSTEDIEKTIKAIEFGNPHCRIFTPFDRYNDSNNLIADMLPLSTEVPQKIYATYICSGSRDKLSTLDDLKKEIQSTLEQVLTYRKKQLGDTPLSSASPITIVLCARVGNNHFANYICNTNGEILVSNTLGGYESWDNAATQAIEDTFKKHGIEPKEVIGRDKINATQKDGSICGAEAITSAVGIKPDLPLKSQTDDFNSLMEKACKSKRYAPMRNIHYDLIHSDAASITDFSKTDIHKWRDHFSPEKKSELRKEEQEKYNAVMANKEIESYRKQLNDLLKKKKTHTHRLFPVPKGEDDAGHKPSPGPSFVPSPK